MTKEEPIRRDLATGRRVGCKPCACREKHAECPVEMDAARSPRPEG